MAEFALAGNDLKRMVKVAKTQPLPFAYCPGPTTPEDLLAMHRTKPGATMAKELRATGEGSKVAFGTVAVNGKLMELACERHLPNLAKRIKRFLKLNKVSLNVQVLDADGNVVDSDIEELPDDPDDLLDEDSADDATPATFDEGNADPSETDAAQLRSLTERFRSVQPFVMSVTGTSADAVRKALASGIGLLKSGDLVQAEKTVVALEAMRSRDDGGAQAKPPSDDGALRGLAVRLQALAPRVAAAPAAMSERLRASLTAAVGAVKGGDAARAEQLVAAIEAVMAKIGDTANGDAGGTPEKPPLNEAQASIARGIAAKRAFLISRWATIPRQIEVPMLAFCAEVADNLPYEDPDELMTAATRYLGGMVETIRAAINDALDADINSGDAVYTQTRREIDAQHKVLDGDPVVSALRNNGLVPGAGFLSAFTDALVDLDAELAK